ncbi:L-serine ammonia-lyase [Sphingorhabdus lutea]|uniref:L-serine dehydratase n=1 Tax=Sphingorhabdus lutea TaxID=1913578 RepID=A0A1L3JDD2_9SPHN|nr:L-serine ammonia-lyase [Sphingorhabdus lutea]APG63099.1 L-serine ammonia-lyase [Sphingorhabdus lutea]
MLSVLDIFRVGLGPSSSHTVGPMRIARRFLEEAAQKNQLENCARLRISLHGSLALTGIGHATDTATFLGLMGYLPEETTPQQAEAALFNLTQNGQITLYNGPTIPFDQRRDLDLRGDIIPQIHPNEMRLQLYNHDNILIFDRIYYSVGGGFIASAKQLNAPTPNDQIAIPSFHPHIFGSAAELLVHCDVLKMSIADVIMANEDAVRPRQETEAGLDKIWAVMNLCIERGLATNGILPGGLKVKRRAPDLYQKLIDAPMSNEREQLFDWLNVYAMAVNEENAAGGRVVTAPTNGAAGIIPAVIRHYCGEDEGYNISKIRQFLVTAGGIAMLYKQRASISGAEMGCQGEVGVACSMAAAGLAAIWGGTAQQVEHAAEIGMEHNLGLTCDPVGGLVQIPCIERNAIGAVKAVNAARLALRACETHHVSLDQVIETMRQTGLDMSRKYKETSEGGLAVNVVEC